MKLSNKKNNFNNLINNINLFFYNFFAKRINKYNSDIEDNKENSKTSHQNCEVISVNTFSWLMSKLDIKYIENKKRSYFICL